MLEQGTVLARRGRLGIIDEVVEHDNVRLQRLSPVEEIGDLHGSIVVADAAIDDLVAG